jgi:hypothetical protein
VFSCAAHTSTFIDIQWQGSLEMEMVTVTDMVMQNEPNEPDEPKSTPSKPKEI